MEYVILAVVIAVVAIGAITGLVVSGKRRRELDRPSQAPTVTAPAPAKPVEGGVEPAAPPTATGATEAPEAPGAPAEQPAAEQPAAEAPTAEEVRAEEAEAAPAIEVPEPTAGRLVRLRSRLSRSQSTLGKGLLTLLSRDRLDEDTWEEIEETLLTADVGVAATQELVDNLRTRVKVLGTRTPDELRGLLREELVKLIGADADRTVRSVKDGDGPAVVLVVGVNGVGKTTTTGKLARVLVADGRKVVLGAADTFRAAAADQLQSWAVR